MKDSSPNNLPKIDRIISHEQKMYSELGSWDQLERLVSKSVTVLVTMPTHWSQKTVGTRFGSCLDKYPVFV